MNFLKKLFGIKPDYNMDENGVKLPTTQVPPIPCPRTVAQERKDNVRSMYKLYGILRVNAGCDSRTLSYTVKSKCVQVLESVTAPMVGRPEQDNFKPAEYLYMDITETGMVILADIRKPYRGYQTIDIYQAANVFILEGLHPSSAKTIDMNDKQRTTFNQIVEEVNKRKI